MRAKDIAAELGARIEGDGERDITRIVPPLADPQPGDLVLAMTPEGLAALRRFPAAPAVAIRQGARLPEHDYASVIEVGNPRLALSALTILFDRPRVSAPGIHPSAVVDSTARLASDVRIGALAVVGPGCVIGAGSHVEAHVTLGAEVAIGADCSIRAGARIGDGTLIGDRVVINENAVIAADGFSFVPPREQGRGALPAKIRSIGRVRIGDDVEIGANTAIDRATLTETVVGNGTKIDNLVQIGHNVRIGEVSLIAGTVGIAGSVIVGDRVLIGGGSKIADHVTIGSDAVVFGGSGVGNNVPENGMVSGYPAIPHHRSAEQVIFISRHKRLLAQIDRLGARILDLENRLGSSAAADPEEKGGQL